MHRWFMLVAAAVPLLLTSFRVPNPHLMWWSTHALEKIRPYDSAPAKPARSVTISAARNEFEPFQIVLRSEAEDLNNVDVEMSDFRGPSGYVIPERNAAIYFESYIDLQKPSNIDGQAGEWPDALIPKIDRFYGERRNAFPFVLRSGRNQPIWIEVYVPQSTPAGKYHADAHVKIDGKRQISIPIELQVWNFGIPSSSSLPNTFGFNGIAAVRQHYGRYTTDDDILRLTYLYQKASLWNRISLHGGAMIPPPLSREGGHVRINWRNYDLEVGPFLDGTAIRDNEPLYGAKSTTVDLRTSGDATTDDLKILYWREFARHFREKKWFDRLFNYVWDEPGPDDFDKVKRKAQLVRSADPAIRNLVTSPLRGDWRNVIDIWSPVINCFELRPGFSPFCNPMAERSEYGDLEAGKALWWYQSCASHGCYVVGGKYFSGWPNYMIDVYPVANRIMQWVTWKMDVQGELYFNMTEAYGKSGRPWEDVNRFGGNGDGTLFYPGRPDHIGGRSQIPVESIRLKLIREGLEDYEYLHLLDAAGASSFAREIVDEIVHKTYDFEHDPEKLYAARRRMAEKLSGEK